MSENSEDIKKLFNEEVRDKKITGYGIHGRAPRKSGLRHAVMTRVDMLSGKEKREYMKGGIIVEYNLYDNVIPLEEFEELPDDKKKDILVRWSKNGITMKKVQEIWGKSIWRYKNYRKQFGLVKPYTFKNRNLETGTTNQEEIAVDMKPIEIKQEELLPFAITINREYAGAELSKKLLNLASYFEKDDSNFDVKVQIIELKK